jgi:galactokinase
MDLHQRILTEFHRRYEADPEYIARAPGRVNLLGEHVDYNEGIVLPAAIDRVTLVAFRKSRTPTSTILAFDLGEETSFDLSSVLNRQGSTGSALPAWTRYPAGVMWSLNAEGLDTPAMEAVFASEVPRGAGLSSSASVEMAFGVAWERLGGWSLAPIQLAKIGLKAEIHYVGLKCGIMDQFASACGVKDRLLFLDCRSLEWRTERLPEETAIVIADTSVRRSLMSSGYNERQAACVESVRILKEFLPGIRSLRDVNVEQFHQLADQLPDLVSKRAQHVVEEITRTMQAVESLENNDAILFGELMNECHASLRDLYDVSCPELDVMVALAQSLPGCYGARLTGAGFGGCTVNLVACESTETFSRDLASGYSKITGLQPELYICQATDGAAILQE